MPKRKFKYPDKKLFWVIISILVVGLVSLVSASIPQSTRDLGNVYGYFVHQLFFGILPGIAVAYILYKLPYKKLKNMAPHLGILGILLMILVFVPQLSVSAGGAQRWIDLGFVSFQPSELVKLAFVIYLAAWMSTHIKEISKKTSLVPFLVFLGILVLLLLLQSDLSTLGIIVMTSLIMYFTAGAKLKHVASLVVGAAAGFVIFVQLSAYRIDRILTFLNPTSDPLGSGYQLNQGLIAIGSGRLWGTGPLQGTQKNFLPVAMNDSIYAVWAEETGFIGAALLIILYLVFLWIGLRLAENIGDNFGKFLAVGIVSWIFIQALINIGSIIGVIPLTGVTLPLISYGSSSIIVTLAAMGILLQLSQKTAN